MAEDKDSIANSHFRADRQIKFIIHGFIDTPLSNWVLEMKNELLEHSRNNQIGMLVVIVDWAGGSLPLYTQATANTRLVGLELAYLIKKLRDEHGLKPQDVHLIGHSLGAHLSAYAAERVPNIGRITALDPAEPYFQGMSNQVRLDPADALVSKKQFNETFHCIDHSCGFVSVCRRDSHRCSKFLSARNTRLRYEPTVWTHRFLSKQWQRAAGLYLEPREQRAHSSNADQGRHRRGESSASRVQPCAGHQTLHGLDKRQVSVRSPSMPFIPALHGREMLPLQLG